MAAPGAVMLDGCRSDTGDWQSFPEDGKAAQ